MEIVSQTAAAMQAVFGENLDDLARTSGCVLRQRKFSGMSLLRTLVLSLLHCPAAKNRDFRDTAARLGVFVSEEAIECRFTDGLVKFLSEALKIAVSQTLAAKPLPATLLEKFSDVQIGDSSTITLPDELADEFPSCGGSGKAALAAMKVQVLWSLKTGQLLRWLIEPGRASDAMSEIAAAVPPAGALLAFDLGYFSLERFRRVGEAEAYWISRLQHNTKVFDPRGTQLSLLHFLKQQGENGLVDMPVLLGEKERLPCRMIAIRVPPEVAARRRRQAHEKARKHGREPSAEYLALLEWTIFVTNCPVELLSWKEVVVLYRARWQIEGFFRTYKHTLNPGAPGLGRTVAQVHREAEASMIATQLLLCQGAMAMPPVANNATPVMCSPRRVLLEARRDISARKEPTEPFAARISRATRERRQRTSDKEKREWPRRKPHTAPHPPILLTLTEEQKIILHKQLQAA